MFNLLTGKRAVRLSEGPKHPQLTHLQVQFDEFGPDDSQQMSDRRPAFDANVYGTGYQYSQKRVSAPGNFTAFNRRPLDNAMAANRPVGVGRAVARSYADAAGSYDVLLGSSSVDNRARTSERQVPETHCFLLSATLVKYTTLCSS